MCGIQTLLLLIERQIEVEVLFAGAGILDPRQIDARSGMVIRLEVEKPVRGVTREQALDLPSRLKIGLSNDGRLKHKSLSRLRPSR